MPAESFWKASAHEQLSACVMIEDEILRVEEVKKLGELVMKALVLLAVEVMAVGSM